jgi:hypothetical protein
MGRTVLATITIALLVLCACSDSPTASMLGVDAAEPRMDGGFLAGSGSVVASSDNVGESDPDTTSSAPSDFPSRGAHTFGSGN